MTTNTNNARGEQQLVVFDLASESYAVDISAVREIIRMQEITSIPRTPEYVKGVINLRGKVTPVVDLRKRFGLPIAEQTAENRTVVVDIGGNDIGVIVDAVTEVMGVPADAVEPPSSMITTDDSKYLLGIVKLDSRLIILLDLEKVLSVEDMDIIQSHPSVAA